jgi:hypothetical protein
MPFLIPKPAEENFRTVLALPDESLLRIGQFSKERLQSIFLTNQIDDQELQALSDELKLPTALIGHAITLLLSVVLAGGRSGELTPNLLKELEIQGLEAKLGILISPVDSQSDEIVKLRQSVRALSLSIPTISDVDVVCDLRALFRAFPSGSPSEKHSKNVKMLLGFEPVIIVSLELNDSSGVDHPSVFQVSEVILRRLIGTLTENL